MPTAATSTLRDPVDIPAGTGTLDGFRRWLRSRTFPERGRIDYLRGEVVADMSPEDLYTHGTPKAEIAAAIHERIARTGRGCVFVDRARVTVPAADLSVEPDVTVVLWSSLESGRVREVPSAGGKPGRFREIEGAPDLVVEVVSDGSVEKDLRRLPELYERSGVGELWIVDARREEVFLDVRIAGSEGFEAVADQDGWRFSPLLACELRLYREPFDRERSTYRLASRPRSAG